MDRITFDGNFCDIAMCQESPCKYPETGCSQRQVWERLKAYEDTGLDPEQIEKARATIKAMECIPYDSIIEAAKLLRAKRAGKLVKLPLVAMVEQSLQDGEMKPPKDQKFNGRYAVVYYDPKKWKAPLIDICGGPYDREQADERAKEIEEACADG